MQTKNDAYKIQLLSYQHSPTVESIMWYNPLGFSSEEALCVANQYRVLRYNQMDQDVSPALEVSLLKQFMEDRVLMIHFLRRLTLPVFPSEVPLQRSLEHQIMQLQLNTEMLYPVWEQYLEANFEILRNIIKSLLSASWDGFSAQIDLLLQILVPKEIIDPVSQVQKQNAMDLCRIYYKPTSKRRVSRKVRAELSDDQQQVFFKFYKCFINKGFQGYSNFKDLYSALTQQLNLSVQKEFEQNNGWICHLRWNKITISKRGSDKKTAYLDATLNFVKLVAPLVFESVMIHCKTNYLSVLSQQGSIRSAELKKLHKFQLEDDFIKNAPFDHLKTEDYIRQLNDLDISKIKKAQNNIIEYLIRISKYKINRSIDSVDSTFVLNLYYQQDSQEVHIHRVFGTSLRFCHAKLIAQQISDKYRQFVIEHLGSLLSKSCVTLGEFVEKI